MTDARRRLPAIGTLLEAPGVRTLLERAPRDLVTDAARRAVDAVRAGAPAPADDGAWAAAVAAQLDDALERSLRPVINATGVILHTNLGRAPLAVAALEAVATVASGYANLEYDLAAGERGSRHRHCAALLCERTGAEDAMVVNNCAAALVLALQALVGDREAIISRGELVEIGGSFRVPDIMATSGATLVEVGTTNRTHATDYEAALGPRTGAIVAVHRSNFTQEGFVASVAPATLAPIAARAGVPLIHDFGSGLLLDLAPWGLRGEPTAIDAVRSGATLVLMSGDKLLGGPQAGIILGSRAAVSRLRSHPLARALRVDKLTLAALEATLALYRDSAVAVREVPVVRMITMPAPEVEARVRAAAATLATRGIAATPVPTSATVGGGAFPGSAIPSWALRLDGLAGRDADGRLRGAATPVVGRVQDDRLLLDLRTVWPADDAPLLTTALEALAR
jgi:L-seryl-tRNA(Ser) seleniumtransferase